MATALKKKNLQLYRNLGSFASFEKLQEAVYGAEGSKDHGSAFIDAKKLKDGEPFALRYKVADLVTSGFNFRTIYGIACDNGNKYVDLFYNYDDMVKVINNKITNSGFIKGVTINGKPMTNKNGIVTYKVVGSTDAGLVTGLNSDFIRLGVSNTVDEITLTPSLLLGKMENLGNEGLVTNKIVATYVTGEIANLDVPDDAVPNQYVSKVVETDGKITVSRENLPVIGVTEPTTDGGGAGVITSFTLSDRKVIGTKQKLSVNGVSFKTESAMGMQGGSYNYLSATIDTDNIKLDSTTLTSETILKKGDTLSTTFATINTYLGKINTIEGKYVSSITGNTPAAKWGALEDKDTDYIYITPSVETSGKVSLVPHIRVTSSVINSGALVTSSAVNTKLGEWEIKDFSKTNGTATVASFNVINSLSKSSTTLAATEIIVNQGTNVKIRKETGNNVYIDATDTKYHIEKLLIKEPSNFIAQYKLVKGEPSGDGITIDIPKDRTLADVQVTRYKATGYDVTKPEGQRFTYEDTSVENECLSFAYITAKGEYKYTVVSIPVGDFLNEALYKNGLKFVKGNDGKDYVEARLGDGLTFDIGETDKQPIAIKIGTTDHATNMNDLLGFDSKGGLIIKNDLDCGTF